MSFNAGSSTYQADAAIGGLSSYFSAMSQYLNNVITTPPDIKDFVSTFDYSEIHREVTLNGYDTPNLAMGFGADAMYMMAALQRELSMCVNTKVGYYQDGASEYIDEANFYGVSRVQTTSAMQGSFDPEIT